ncbi:hypothetical protein [Periweissella ghanensis]|uniref:DUF4169 domain-containing protein n=1 Tax=Periweissella ghanensis TaxID=467997 RepID=A0ABM8ZDF1_9LACO|nr:hypothetical protein [Periweissella ghanensis]MCM0601298.1 hypothetical protein [Periweissella ghanensis]CAH0419360.1 hypothetical protein WGH24286_01810 [Periweissella ghanensis]
MANKLSKSARKELAEQELQRRAKDHATQKHESGFAHLRDLEDKFKHEN